MIVDSFIFVAVNFRGFAETEIFIDLTKIKRQFFIGQRPFDSRLYLDISRSFKSPKSSPVVCLIFITCGRFVSCFVLREYILEVHILVSSEYKLCQT